MPFGAELQADGSVRFRLWAPSHPTVRLAIEGEVEPLAMAAEAGWHEVVTDRARAGSRYRFILPDGLAVPDPASRHQPEDVHGPSEVIDPAAYRWRDASWRGRPWEEAVIYELHVGAFTAPGTFRAAIDRLDGLVALGVTAIQLMPVSDFPGRRNWGYDGVLPYAPDSAYGRPEDLKALVEAAHERGLMVFLDVVYNHFGPEGAYMHAIAPEFFTQRHKTPWGAAINTDGAQARPVRDFIIHNALYWLEEFHLDGLRLDAVHEIRDDSPVHLLDELADRVRASVPHRTIHLILENEENEARRLERADRDRPRQYTAQWNDDVHHVLHVAVTGERDGYYADYAGQTQRLGRALAEGFAFQGDLMPYRGSPRGEPSAALPPAAFIAFLQNHDQVGNRAFGERIHALAPPEAVRAASAVHLLMPQIPMLFMGEEWQASTPFPFFCDFAADLAEAVRKGRRAEFARFPQFQDEAIRETIPDPTAEATFRSAKLRWEERDAPLHRSALDHVRLLLAVRRERILPLLRQIRTGGRFEVLGEGAVRVRWPCGRDRGLVLAANLSPDPVDLPPTDGETIWREGEVERGRLGAWSVWWGLETVPEDQPRQRPLDALRRLAARMDIELSFRNAHGDMVDVSDETLKDLLAAMGCPAADEAQAEEALARLDAESWREPLPPVAVLRAGEAGRVALTREAGSGALLWRIVEENGGERAGQGGFAELPLIEARDLDGRRLERRELLLPPDLPLGYHRLQVDDASMTLITVPRACWLPERIRNGGRLWGIAAQLYLLRSGRNWGIGDFRDLEELVALSAREGADVIGLNPLHALFPDEPEQASPYSPASRLLLNVLNIAVDALPGFVECREARERFAAPDAQAVLEAARGADLVDYAGVAALKLGVLERLFAAFVEKATGERREAFARFRRERGEEFERTCLFMALREHFAGRPDVSADWSGWPPPFRHPDSPEVARFRRDHQSRIDFFAWLQWLADEQLGRAAAACREAGMRVGLYRDLAVGADRAGAETWANPAVVVAAAQVGAPPDIHIPTGQDWGLPPFNPRALRQEAYCSFISLLRANMRHAGGLRIDHVMGLQHLYWVPKGRDPAAGAYVRYPLDDLVGILALESCRHRCLVVGEDLGTVPEGFRERMAEANILSYRVMFFEQDVEAGSFLPPGRYPRLGLAVVGSHDLPTLRGWWEGRDLDLKARLGLLPTPELVREHRTARERERRALLGALRQERLLGDSDPAMPELARAVHAFLARTPCALAMVQIDDLTDEVEPVNVPTTSDEHPNWRRRLSQTLHALSERPRFRDIAALMREARGGSSEP
jgi:malto-oligosyltrehalose trehalohydrolase/4-alpha-glucanotransferase